MIEAPQLVVTGIVAIRCQLRVFVHRGLVNFIGINRVNPIADQATFVVTSKASNPYLGFISACKPLGG